MSKKIKDKYLDLSNAELRVKLLTMENEYEALKIKLKETVEKMEKLNDEYIEMKQVLTKRTGGQA